MGYGVRCGGSDPTSWVAINLEVSYDVSVP
jgi:hypothetical protein